MRNNATEAKNKQLGNEETAAWQQRTRVQSAARKREAEAKATLKKTEGQRDEKKTKNHFFIAAGSFLLLLQFAYVTNNLTWFFMTFFLFVIANWFFMHFFV